MDAHYFGTLMPFCVVGVHSIIGNPLLIVIAMYKNFHGSHDQASTLIKRRIDSEKAFQTGIVSLSIIAKPEDKNKLYALHAPEVECIGKARKRYEFGVKACIAITHKNAKIFPGNPYDGHILHKQLTQTQILLKDAGSTPRQVIVDLGFRGADADNPDVNIIHRGKYKSLTKPQQRWLKRRQAVEPAIGHLKSDHRMDRCCWLQGKLGDALYAVLCAAGYNLRWLMRAVLR